MIFDFGIDEKVCFSKASLSCGSHMWKNKKVVFTGKGMLKVYTKFYFAHNFLRHDFVRFWKKWKFPRTCSLNLKKHGFKNAKNDIKVLSTITQIGRFMKNGLQKRDFEIFIWVGVVNFDTFKTGSKGRPKVERVFETFWRKTWGRVCSRCT